MPSLKEQVEEVQLVRASTSGSEFQWKGSDEEKRIWESILESDYDQSKKVSSPFAFALRLSEENKKPELWLNINYRQETSDGVQLNVHGPYLERTDLDRVKRFVEKRHEEAMRGGFDNIVFDVFTAVQAYLAEEPIQESSRVEETQAEENLKPSIEVNREVKMARVIFWSHHLKAPSKKRDMTAWCSELGLWGLVKSGYPGYLCFEGIEDDVVEIVRRIKALQWHAIQVKTDERYIHYASTTCSNMDQVRQEAIGLCLLKRGHSAESHKEQGPHTKWRTTMDEVESGKELVERFMVACISPNEYRSALNLR